MPNGDQFTITEMMEGLGLPTIQPGEGSYSRARNILREFEVQRPEDYIEGLQRLLRVAGEQVGGLGEEYSGLLGNLQSEYATARGGLASTFQTAIGGLAARHRQEMGGLRTGFETGIGELRTGRETGMRGLREAWMEQAREDQGDWQLGGRKRRLKRARRAAGVEQREMQTAFETGRKGLRAGYETARAGEQTAFGAERERLQTGYGAQREALRTGYESDIFGAEQWMGGQYRDLLASLESRITEYISGLRDRGAEFGDNGDKPESSYDDWTKYRDAGGGLKWQEWLAAGRPDVGADDVSRDEPLTPGWPGVRRH